MSHVLVTGGAGYLGSILVHELLLRHYSVTVLDNFMYRQASLNHLCTFDKLEVIRGDAREIASRPGPLKKADIVIPLAAIVGAGACDLDRAATVETNYHAIAELCCVASPNQLIVYPNTNSGYGRGGETYCTEDSPLTPVSLYGVSKVKAEKVVLNHALAVSLRFATLFGASPRMRLDLMVNDFVYRAVRDGHLLVYEADFRRNFLHVRDASHAIVHAIENASAMTGKPYNAGRTDANMTKKELAQRILARVIGPGHGVLETAGKDPDQRDYVVSNERLEGTGWKAMYTIDEGIEELIRCYAQPFEMHRNT